jgi:hypothetical protein
LQYTYDGRTYDYSLAFVSLSFMHAFNASFQLNKFNIGVKYYIGNFNAFYHYDIRDNTSLTNFWDFGTYTSTTPISALSLMLGLSF